MPEQTEPATTKWWCANRECVMVGTIIEIEGGKERAYGSEHGDDGPCCYNCHLSLHSNAS